MPCEISEPPGSAAPMDAGESGQRSLSVVPDDLRALQAVVEGTAAGVGRDFFRSLVRHLAEAIDVQYAAVCEFLAPPNGRVLTFWDGDYVAEDFVFQFTTSPAAEVLTKAFAHFPTAVLKRFPNAIPGRAEHRRLHGCSRCQ